METHNKLTVYRINCEICLDHFPTVHACAVHVYNEHENVIVSIFFLYSSLSSNISSETETYLYQTLKVDCEKRLQSSTGQRYDRDHVIAP